MIKRPVCTDSLGLISPSLLIRLLLTCWKQEGASFTWEFHLPFSERRVKIIVFCLYLQFSSAINSKQSVCQANVFRVGMFCYPSMQNCAHRFYIYLKCEKSGTHSLLLNSRVFSEGIWINYWQKCCDATDSPASNAVHRGLFETEIQ